MTHDNMATDTYLMQELSKTQGAPGEGVRQRLDESRQSNTKKGSATVRRDKQARPRTRRSRILDTVSVSEILCASFVAMIACGAILAIAIRLVSR